MCPVYGPHQQVTAIVLHCAIEQLMDMMSSDTSQCCVDVCIDDWGNLILSHFTELVMH